MFLAVPAGIGAVELGGGEGERFPGKAVPLILYADKEVVSVKLCGEKDNAFFGGILHGVVDQVVEDALQSAASDGKRFRQILRPEGAGEPFFRGFRCSGRRRREAL